MVMNVVAGEVYLDQLLQEIDRPRVRGDQFERENLGNRFLHLKSGGTIVLGPPHTAEVPHPSSITMPRPVSLGEMLARRPLRRSGIVFPDPASATLSPARRDQPASVADDRTVLSAAEGERFVLVHGDNYGCVECRDADGWWRAVETVAEYLPAGTNRRYLRRVGEAYGEFQRRSGGKWENECPAGTRRHRLYLIDSRFEMLTDAEYERRHGSKNDWPPVSLGT